MAIRYNEVARTFTLETKKSTYQMKVDEHGVLLHTYYGKRMTAVDLSYMISYKDRGFSGNPYDVGDKRTYSLDVLPQEISCFGSGDFRTTALKVRQENGVAVLDLRYHNHTILTGKYSIPGLPAMYEEDHKAATLDVVLKDKESEIYVHLYYGVLEELDMITRTVIIENKQNSPIFLDKVCSMNLDFQFGEYDLLTFYGKHAMEREVSRVPVHHGKYSIGSTRGSSSHHYNPFMILCDHEATEDYGECYGFSFLYSGDFVGEAELDQMNQTRVTMGIHPDNFCFRLDKGEKFHAPEVAMAYSSTGFETLSKIYHNAYRNNLCRGQFKTARRPILINNWEGTYFQFTGEKLIQMAKEAASLGIELFVMDDGWFGRRDDDTSSLGDWFVNEDKLGCTLKELSDEIVATGMQFGIWFEPECISENSDLYKEHPEWVLMVPNRKPTRSRYQLVLDLSRQDVRDYLYTRISSVLNSAKITYLKWDFNRSISDIYSTSEKVKDQGEVAHRYVLGLYELLEKLTIQFPHVLFEGCSGGGGRFDAGMLYYTPQIWCSDNTDAIDRIKIQYGTSFGYPISSVGSHVSICPNHQSGRITPLATRGIVAMAGTSGYELDVNALSEFEKEQIKRQVGEMKMRYSLIQNGDYYRLTNPYLNGDYAVWEFAQDGEEALVSIVSTHVSGNQATDFVRLKGLKENGWYRCNDEEQLYLGSALMYAGLQLPQPKEEYQAWNLYFKLVKTGSFYE